MTISTEVRKAGPFIGNDSASVFPFAFKVFKAADLIVVRRQDNIDEETTLVLDSDYHVTLNSNQDTTPGGVVTLVAGALASGFTLVVSSELPYLQTTDLTNQGGFYPKVITNALDRLTIFCQQLAEITGRTLKLPITAPTNISAEIPLPNPSELIAWDETGTRLTTISPQSLVTSIAYGSATADLFAGDGVTTTFPLSTNPASVNNLDVSVGGFSQRPVQGGIGDYSWNGGASITFVEPPPVPTVPGDKNVLVRYMQAIPVSDSEALHAQTREALRRSYAEAGYNLVEGSFETGGTLASTSDVLLLESAGTAYAWTGAYPGGGYDVAPGIDPTVSPGYVPRTDAALRDELAAEDGANLVGGATYVQIRAYSGAATKIHCLGRVHLFDGAHGDFCVDLSDTTSLDNDGTTIVDVLGRRWKRQYSGRKLAAWWGVIGDGTTPCAAQLAKALSYGGEIDLPEGTILLESTVDIGSNTQLRGSVAAYKTSRGTRFRLTGAGYTACFRFYDSTQAFVENITLSHFGVTNGFGVLANNASAFILNSAANMYVRELKVEKVFTSDFKSGFNIAHGWMIEFDSCTIQSTNDGEVGIRVAQGTSVTARNCYVWRHKYGYDIQTGYSALYTCAADYSQIAQYRIKNSVKLYSCGAEHIYGSVVSVIGSAYNSRTPAIIENMDASAFHVGSAIVNTSEGTHPGSAKIIDSRFSASVGDATYAAYSAIIPAIVKGSDYYTSSVEFVGSTILQSDAVDRESEWPIANNHALVTRGTNGQYVNISYRKNGNGLRNGDLDSISSPASAKAVTYKFKRNEWGRVQARPIDSQVGTYKIETYFRDVEFICSASGALYLKSDSKFTSGYATWFYTLPTDANSVYVTLIFPTDIDNNLFVEVVSGDAETVSTASIVSAAGAVKLTPVATVSV